MERTYLVLLNKTPNKATYTAISPDVPGFEIPESNVYDCIKHSHDYIWAYMSNRVRNHKALPLARTEEELRKAGYDFDKVIDVEYFTPYYTPDKTDMEKVRRKPVKKVVLAVVGIILTIMVLYGLTLPGPLLFAF